MTPTTPDNRAPSIEPASLSRYFRALGDPTRLRIITVLLEGERTVSDLVDILGVPQSRVSNHLACLKWCRFVTAEQRGRSVIYRLADDEVGNLLHLAASLAEPNGDHLMSCSRIGPEWT
jgi:ArsR family transcriptional regulator